MTWDHLRKLGVIASLAAAACSPPWHMQPLPMPVSHPQPGTGEFRAGAFSIDLTPPPGVGLGGAGPEGRRSTGYRTRLYAHAIVLEDATGERVALVVADLAHISANLHRLAAERVVASTGIGADRLILSATHTHSGPAHFYGERQYNSSVSRVGGYDPRLVDFLVQRIADAVEAAASDLKPATISSGTIIVPGVTRNRSLAAHCQNVPVGEREACKDSTRNNPVDSTLFLMRIDRVTRSGTVPLGSYSVFAIHGTAIPTANTLLDGDVHTRFVQRLAEHADSRAHGLQTVHALANGAEGDVAPRVDRACPLPKVDAGEVFPMPRASLTPVDFVPGSPRVIADCVSQGVAEAGELAAVIADRAIMLYDRLGRARPETGVAIRRSFTTVWLPGVGAACSQPELGSATAAGAEGAESRVRGWKWIIPGVLRFGFEEGGTAVDSSAGCQSPKLPLLKPFQSKLVVGEHGFPETAQLMAVRIGDALLAAVPAEVTTAAWDQMKTAMRTESTGSGWTPRETVLIGLANGFLQYVTTAPEYGAQHYEGGSNLYGPGTAALLASRLASLAASIANKREPSPPALVGPISAYPGPPSEILASAQDGSEGVAAKWRTTSCKDGVVIGEWVDQGPGRLFSEPASRDSALIQVSADGQLVGRDGDGWVEVHVGKKDGKGTIWQVRYRADSAAARSYVFKRFDAKGMADSSSAQPCQGLASE